LENHSAKDHNKS